MSTIIKQFTNRKKQKVASKTPEHAVYDENGIRLDYKLKSLTNSIKTIVIEYLKEHPEMIVALQDGSVTEAKLAEDVHSWLVDLGDRIKEESSNARQNEQELYDKFRSIEKTLDNITKTGEASSASNVTLQSISGIVATNVQDAISEIVNDASKIKSNTESLEGNNVQENLNDAGERLSELESQVIYDVSAHNNGATFESLQALLNSDNLSALIPTAVRCGGMSIRFIQSSDNKYVQYRLMDNEWSTNAEDWAVADEGVYVENPEFVYVRTDAEGKILLAIKNDGDVYYGAGCPQQVKDYIEEKISSLSLDEYEDIVAFLSDYLESDATLKTMIDDINTQIAAKLDAEGLDPDALETVQSVENLEYIQVTTDNEDKILEGITSKGVKRINLPIDTPSATIEHVENPEWVSVTTDSKGKVLEGLKENGEKVVNVDTKYPNGIPSEIRKYVDESENTNYKNYNFKVSSITELQKNNATILRDGNNPCFSIDRKTKDCLYVYLKVKFPSDVHDVSGNFNLFKISNSNGNYLNAYLHKALTAVRTVNPKYPIPVYKSGIYTTYNGQNYDSRDVRCNLVPDNLERHLLMGYDAMSIRFTGDCSIAANQDIMFESTDEVFRILHSSNDATIKSYAKSDYATMRDFYKQIAQDIENNVLEDYEVEFLNLNDYTPYDIINCKVHLVAPYQIVYDGEYNTYKSYPYYFTAKDINKKAYDIEFLLENGKIAQMVVDGFGIYFGNNAESTPNFIFNNDVTMTFNDVESPNGAEILQVEIADIPNYKYPNLRMLFTESVDSGLDDNSGYYISPDSFARLANNLRENGCAHATLLELLNYIRGSKKFNGNQIWHFRHDDSSWDSIMIEKNLETYFSKDVIPSFGIMMHNGVTEEKINKAKTVIPLGFGYYPHTAYLPNDPEIGGGQIGLGLLSYTDFRDAVNATISQFVTWFGFRPIVWDFHTVDDGGYNTSAYLRNHGFELILRQTGRGLISSINRYGAKAAQMYDQNSHYSEWLMDRTAEGYYINCPAMTYVHDVPEE